MYDKTLSPSKETYKKKPVAHKPMQQSDTQGKQLLYDPFRKWSFIAKEGKFNAKSPFSGENDKTTIEESDETKPLLEINSKAKIFASNKSPDTNIHQQGEEFAAEEIAFIVEGSQKYGNNWEYIKSSFNFKPSRSAEQIAEQYIHIVCNYPQYFSNKMVRLPFTSCEDRRLRRGIAKYGENNWKTILSDYLFAPNRSECDLKERWNFLRQ